jgi:uncharacterized protein
MIDYSNFAPGVYVEQVPSGTVPIAGVSTSTAAFVGAVPDSVPYDKPDGTPDTPLDMTAASAAPVNVVRLVTNFTEFKNWFGNFSKDAGQSTLAHAVFGFFNNGGSRCYVTRVVPGAAIENTSIATALALFDPIDEIAIVAAPGLSGIVPLGDLKAHVAANPTRFAILDTASTVANYTTDLAANGAALPTASDATAVYFPWIQIFDPATKSDPVTNGLKYVPPSGHMAGVYARVDARRGVHKAPANEPVLGALDLKYAVSAAQQGALNAAGVNCIRKLNGDILVWGARTRGGAAEFKYINVRRLFNFLRGSIEQGTQWAVFEPNNPDLWAKITRNVSAFLNIVWTSGGLIGDTAAQAYYVKCDAETNPPATRDLGEVITEIGVAITRPAEFVVFRMGQKAAS